MVIAKIRSYISAINPSNVIYIAFEGVAPLAKMEQQRIRRYKTGYLASIDFWKDGCEKPIENAWSTSAITPGTAFMDLLSVRIKMEFENANLGAKTVIVSASDEAGEGEHKMFQYMRDNALQNETIAVYGLDSDLIMLSLFHCFACQNIYIFREAPAFGKLVEERFQSDELIYLDHRALSKAILREMGITGTQKGIAGTQKGITGTQKGIANEEARMRIYDYIFMCFLLGNDFLPHFPSLNIRTHGNSTILETYKRVIGNHVDRRFIGTETGNIQWRWVKAFLCELAKDESRTMLTEYESRHKMEKRFYPTTKKEEREAAFDNIPTIYRAEEHYINPSEPGWESRYYKTAFHLDGEPQKPFVESVCVNYLEGLEWVFRYYTEGCPHWRWKYAFHYPPLFRDLVKYVPDFETNFIDELSGINKPFHPYTQLCYVIPKWNHEKVLPKKALKLAVKNATRYVDMKDLKFQWMFCKYFWESHALLPEMPLKLLEEIDEKCISYGHKDSLI
jgi:5'-3' exonuclease